MQLPLRLKLQPSRSLAALLVLLHLAALAGLVPLDFPPWLKLLAGAAVSASAVASIRRHASLTAPGSVRELVLLADGSIEGERRGRSFTAAVSRQSTVFPWLVVLLLEAPAWFRPLPVVILPDSLPPDEMRALRSWLRWKASGA